MPRHPSLATASISELLRLHGELLDELRDRQVIRTNNGPTGDYAEFLFASAFGWTLNGNSKASDDARASDGTRYQIKGLRLTRPGQSRQLSTIRGLAERGFDWLGAVMFDSDMSVRRAALIPYDTVVKRATKDGHVNGSRFMLADMVWELPGVRDVTVHLREAADNL